MTTEALWGEQFPKANRFIVTFRGKHLLTDGTFAYHDRRRFVLADNANDALEEVRRELSDKKFWPPGLHEAHNIQVGSASDYDPYPDYFRFGRDIRKQTVERKNHEQESNRPTQP